MITSLLQRLWGGGSRENISAQTGGSQESRQDSYDEPRDTFERSQGNADEIMPRVIFNRHDVAKGKNVEVLNDFLERYHRSRYNMVV